MKKIISVVISVCLLMSMAVCVSATTDSTDGKTKSSAVTEQKLDIKAKSVILMEPYTGEILYEDNADEVLPPASITKVMSLLLIMEALEKGIFTTETVVTASEHACSMGGSQIWLEPGESMTVDDLLKATVIVSANDATVALGELVAGSEEGFVALMNERAKELGMNNTNFVNCTGLDAKDHLTSAHDIAIMSAELIKYPLIKNYTTVWMDTLRNGESELVNTNKLVRFYSGTTGLKTGTTSNSGYCLSATAMRDGLELVAVVMGADTTNDRFNGAKKLLDFGFANYAFSEIEGELEDNFTVSVEDGIQNKLEANTKDKLGLLMKKSEKTEIRQEITLNKKIVAPIKEGDKIGSISVYMGEEMIGEIPIIAMEKIDKLTFSKIFSWILTGLFVL